MFDIRQRSLSLLFATAAICGGTACSDGETGRSGSSGEGEPSVAEVVTDTDAQGLTTMAPAAGTSGTPAAKVVPRQLIVKFKADGARALTDCAAVTLSRGRSFSGATPTSRRRWMG
jgi:hypothetical protein